MKIRIFYFYMMSDAIKNFPKQFEFQPVIERAEKLKKTEKFVLAGMGGSHLAGGLLKTQNPYLDMVIHRDYALPALNDVKDRLIIASSYSGNTEEVIDVFEKALEKGLSLAVISVGGKLIDLAKEHDIPYIQMPDTGIQPRSALGFSIMGLLKFIGAEDELGKMLQLSKTLACDMCEEMGKDIAEKLRGRVPIIYSSTQNEAIAYNWKIKFNETGKIPAFYNVFSELNHNEMTGYDVIETTRDLSEKFHFIFLRDADDHPRIQKRMKVCKTLYEERGLPVDVLEFSGESRWHKIFTSILVADWTAYYTSQGYGAESEQVPMVEQFKKLI